MRFLAGLLIGAAAVFAAAFFIQTRDHATASREQESAPQPSSQHIRQPVAEPDFEDRVGDRVGDPADVTAEKTAAIDPIDHAPNPHGPVATDPLPDLSSIPPTMEQATVAEQLASVWAPFHSEASAKGFARRLADEIGEPFTVHRTGPANYHVVFPFNSEQDRARIADQIAKVTGMPQP